MSTPAATVSGAAADAAGTGAPLPAWMTEPIEAVANDDLTEYDLLTPLTAVIDSEGPVGAHIDSFNQLLESGLRQIVLTLFPIEMQPRNVRDKTPEDRAIEHFHVKVQFTRAEVFPPEVQDYESKTTRPMTPSMARRQNLTYSAPLKIAATISVRAIKNDGTPDIVLPDVDIPFFQVSTIPLMVGSSLCVTSKSPRAAMLAAHGEDPYDPRGYFIVNGREYAMVNIDNTTFNEPHLYTNRFQGTVARTEFLSKPGDTFENSAQVIVRLRADGQITFNIRSIVFREVFLPFYVVFRLLGMASDADLMNTVVYGPGSPRAGELREILGRAFQAPYAAYEHLRYVTDREELARQVSEIILPMGRNAAPGYERDADAVRYLNDYLLTGLDLYLLPHIGVSRDDRPRKLQFAGHLIRHTLLGYLGEIPPSDRNSLRNKRVHPAGIQFSKAFKTGFNATVGKRFRAAIKSELKTIPFENINLQHVLTRALSTSASDLGAELVAAIQRGDQSDSDSVPAQRKIKSRISSKALDRKNHTNVLSVLRTVETNNAGIASKQTEQADRMRRVHPTYTGYFCVSKSPDTGPKVGIPRELAIGATVSGAGVQELLKRRIREDASVTPIGELRDLSAIPRDNLSRIFVNGDWIGVTPDPRGLAARFRLLRRRADADAGVDLQTSISWNPETGDVKFGVEYGRLLRTLLIVDNNAEAYDAAVIAAHKGAKKGTKQSAEDAKGTKKGAKGTKKGAKGGAAPRFTQNIRLTTADIRHMASRPSEEALGYLLERGLVEYISPEEAENCYVAPSLRDLREARHDPARRYTHCDIEQAIFSLTTLIAAFGNYTQPARVTYETNQAKQTCGWYVTPPAHQHRVDKNRFLAYYAQTPLVRTLANKYTFPNGLNAYVAYACMSLNQEDSVIINAASASRGLFAGHFYRYVRVTLEANQHFGVPNSLETKNPKAGASYELLDASGFVRPGATIRKNDVIVGCVTQNPRPTDGFRFTDTSHVYPYEEPATVESVFEERDAEHHRFVVVKFRYYRPLRVGDKLSTRSGNKMIAAVLMPEADMPYDEDGVVPDLIMNPHAIPTRMTVGQMLEGQLAEVCARRGLSVDATAFTGSDPRAVAAELRRLGVNVNGGAERRLYNGETGLWIDAMTFMQPTFFQRLEKFVIDEFSTVTTTRKDALTHQPLEGASSGGGLKWGEMETWTIAGQGAIATLSEKTRVDSDRTEVYICRPCGQRAIYNEGTGRYRCPRCLDAAVIEAVDSGWAAQVYDQEQTATRLKVEYDLEPFTRYRAE